MRKINGNNDGSITVQASQTILSQSQNYKTTFEISQKLPTLASEVSMAKYKSRLGVLHRICKLWEMDKDVGVFNIDEVSRQ